MARYRFSEFVLSPRRRVLARDGRELPLIPRYFDLLVFLVAHRHEAVHRRDIFDRVWSDVVVSDIPTRAVIVQRGASTATYACGDRCSILSSTALPAAPAPSTAPAATP